MTLAAAWAEKRRAAGMVPPIASYAFDALPAPRRAAASTPALMVAQPAPSLPTATASPDKARPPRSGAPVSVPRGTIAASSVATGRSEERIRRPRRAAAKEPAKSRVSHKDISAEQELELIRRCQAGDRRAGEILIQAHEPIIYKTAKRYFNKGLDAEDVLQLGRIGFLTGIQKFDPSHGTRLTTYATKWVVHETGRAMRNLGSTIRIPSHMHDKINGALKRGEELTDELCAAGNLRLVYDLDAPLGENRRQEKSIRTFGDATADLGPSPEMLVLDAHEQERRKHLVEHAMCALTDQERDIIQRRLLADNPEGLAEIGATYGRSRERIRQIEAEALQKLNKSLKHTIALA